jgi:hypothetical protein
MKIKIYREIGMYFWYLLEIAQRLGFYGCKIFKILDLRCRR